MEETSPSLLLLTLPLPVQSPDEKRGWEGKTMYPKKKKLNPIQQVEEAISSQTAMVRYYQSIITDYEERRAPFLEALNSAQKQLDRLEAYRAEGPDRIQKCQQNITKLKSRLIQMKQTFSVDTRATMTPLERKKAKLLKLQHQMLELKKELGQEVEDV